MLYQPMLAAIRAALCDRIDAEAVRQQRLATPDVSLPGALLVAALWLTANGCDDPPCPGEVFFAWGTTAYRRYLDRLSDDQRATLIEEGRQFVFDGRGHRPPLLERFTDRIDGFCLDAA